MNRNTSILLASMFILAAMIIGLPASTMAASGPSVLANDGVVYEARTGTYGSLFQDDAVQPARRVLALVETTGITSQTVLVPTTNDTALDHLPTLIYDAVDDAISIVWERRDSVDTEIQLIRFDNGTWSDVTTLLARPTDTSLGTSRRLARDGFGWSANTGTPTRSDRAILHFAWRDEGAQDVRYAPFIFLEGQFAGWSESLSLLELFDVDDTLPAGDPSLSLLEALSVELSADGQTIQTAFTDPRSGHTVVLEIDAQPLDLAFFGAEIRAGLAELAAHYQAGSATSIEGPMRATIVAGGQRLGLDDNVVTYMANTIETWAQDWTAIHPDSDFAAFSAALLDLVNDLTLALFTGANGGQVIELDLDDNVTLPSQLFRVHVASAHPAPTTGNGLHRIFTSSDGSRMLVAWYEATTGLVRYIESTGDSAAPWSDPATIGLSESMTRERVERLLQQRIR